MSPNVVLANNSRQEYFGLSLVFIDQIKRMIKTLQDYRLLVNVFIYKSACQTSLSYLPRKDPRDVHRRVVGRLLMLHTAWALVFIRKGLTGGLFKCPWPW